jgi:hypothetical protein
VRHRREHFIRIAELSSRFEHLRMMQQRAIEHAMPVDHQPIVNIEPRVEHRLSICLNLGCWRGVPRSAHGIFTNQLPMHRIGDPYSAEAVGW